MRSHPANGGECMAKEAIDLLRGLIFDLLLVTDGRTTDLLETILNEKMKVHVIYQGEADEAANASSYIRESVLMGENSGMIVSHNFALVRAEALPSSLFEKIAQRQEGIGTAISSGELLTFRKVLETGWISPDQAVDLFRKPMKLRFPENIGSIPFKRYSISFRPEPGIEMLEYYHPELVTHRLMQTLQAD